MQVSLTATGGLERRLEVAVPATEVTTEVEQRLKNISRTARLKGFRPGKAPITVVRKQFGEQVHAEVVSDLMRSTFAQALSQEKLTPAGGPRPPGRAGQARHPSGMSRQSAGLRSSLRIVSSLASRESNRWSTAANRW